MMILMCLAAPNNAEENLVVKDSLVGRKKVPSNQIKIISYFQDQFLIYKTIITFISFFISMANNNFSFVTKKKTNNNDFP